MEQNSKFTKICSFLVCLLFLGCAVFVTYALFTAGGEENTVRPLILVCVVIGLELLAIGHMLLQRFEGRLEKAFPAVFIGFLAVTFLLQLLPANALRFTPAWDMGAVYNGALSWIEHGDLSEYSEYFLYFPNNFGTLLLYKIVFSLTGWADPFLTAAVMGSLSVTVTRFAAVLLCKKTAGMRYAYACMLLLLLCPPLYFMGIAFYTDTLSLWAPVLALLLFVCGRQSQKLPAKLGWYAGAALAAAFGAQIKFTVIIVVIAEGLTLLIRKEWKELLLAGIVHALVIAAVFGAVSGIYYRNFDRETAARQNTPLTHWFMMGAQGDGRYNGGDYDFTRSFSTVEERDTAVRAEVLRRYREMGAEGILQLWARKTAVDFGDGTCGISDFLDDGVMNRSGIHDWLLYEGRYYRYWQAICNGSLLLLLLLAVGSVLGFLRRGQQAEEKTALLRIILYMNFLGIWCFLMLWESSPRYFSNSMGMILVTAVLGIPDMLRAAEGLTERIKAAYQRH